MNKQMKWEGIQEKEDGVRCAHEDTERAVDHEPCESQCMDQGSSLGCRQRLGPWIQSVELRGGRAGTTQGWLEQGEAVLCFWEQGESQLRTGRTVGEEEARAGRVSSNRPSLVEAEP